MSTDITVALITGSCTVAGFIGAAYINSLSSKLQIEQDNLNNLEDSLKKKFQGLHLAISDLVSILEDPTDKEGIREKIQKIKDLLAENDRHMNETLYLWKQAKLWLVEAKEDLLQAAIKDVVEKIALEDPGNYSISLARQRTFQEKLKKHIEWVELCLNEHFCANLDMEKLNPSMSNPKLYKLAFESMKKYVSNAQSLGSSSFNLFKLPWQKKYPLSRKAAKTIIDLLDCVVQKYS